MSPGKERKALVFDDFRRQTKIVTVVAFLDEKEAGGKAVSREKERLGLVKVRWLTNRGAPFRDTTKFIMGGSQGGSILLGSLECDKPQKTIS